MSKYIDVEKLKAEIDKLHDAPVPKHDQQCDFSDGYSWGLNDIENLIDSLQQEQPEVDLEKKIQEYIQKLGFGYGGWVDGLSDEDLKNIARHFYELGQQEMRHRITNPEYNAKVVEQLKSEYPARKEEKK